ncbi:PREDICTED: leucine-rich PPR motif-containing protein, mitochondrial-like isoform X2 [Vollenhovia emeryi]|uniref:leucine-rich PPR motif-containing protein, mitochondrial-like isoform X2 n=1 Tax=Vollenhovia emeryi TaxID=411798 RepID=UPI0005F42375|nr:PREDICTED: leucine-rich PPR motif-containing protein, mitochondrial-like isoform X2 [Vollenhovia emeryi]
MIEAEKMLQLRKYLTLVVHSQLRSPRCGTARSRPPRRGGYVLGYVHPRHASLRPGIPVVTCNRTYCTTIPQSSRSDDVDHKLMSFCDDVKKGRVSADHLREVIDLCSKSDYQLPDGTGVLLLKCCGNLLPGLETAERDYLADQVWHLAKKSGEGLTLEYYNALLGINEENSKFVNPKKFLANMSVAPDENTYRLLLNSARKASDAEYLWEFLSVIKDKNMAIHEEAINGLVEMYVMNGNIAEAERTITLLQEAKLCTAKAYAELACGYAKLGDIPNLVKILNDEPQSNANLLKIIKALSMSNNGRHIPVVLNLLVSSVPALESEISKMIAELVRANQIENVQIIINCFAMNNVASNIVQGFVNSFMNELLMLNAPVNDVVKYANHFVDSGCSQRTLTDMAEVCLKLGREKLCLALFQAMRKRNMEVRPHYYWPLLLKAYHNKGEAKMFSLVKSMIDKGVEMDSETLLHYVFPYVNTADPIVTLQKLLLNNVPGAISYTPLLLFLLQQNRLQDIKSLCTNRMHCKVYYRELIKPLVRAYLATKDYETCVTLLTAFPQGQDFVSLFLESLFKAEKPVYIEDLLFLLNEVKRCEIKIPQEDAIILKNTLKCNKNFNVMTKVEDLIDELVDPKVKESAFLFLPKYMNTKELAYFLVELKSIKANTRNVLQKLLILYCFENNLKRVEEIKREHDECKYTWSSSMKSTLFEFYLKHNKLKEAEALVPESQIMSGDIQLDKIKIVMYATALVKAGKPRKAFDVIDTVNVFDTNVNLTAQTQCCTLLQTLAQSQYHEHTKSMLHLLLQKNYCKKSMDLLRPLVVIPLERNDILGAVDVIAECGQRYNEAPLILEVLTILLEQMYSSKLPNANIYVEQVLNIAATVYSDSLANTFLALALTRLKKTEKLQALLQNYELSKKCLLYYIKNAKTDRDLDDLQNLFRAYTNYSHQISMSDELLSVYTVLGDCNRALELWKVMCTKNITPSEKFKKNFTQFLLSHKVSLPPELENESKRNVN